MTEYYLSNKIFFWFFFLIMLETVVYFSIHSSLFILPLITHFLFWLIFFCSLSFILSSNRMNELMVLESLTSLGNEDSFLFSKSKGISVSAKDPSILRLSWMIWEDLIRKMLNKKRKWVVRIYEKEKEEIFFLQ